MPVDVKKILDELGASGDERAAVEKFFANPSTHQKVSDWYENGLRQSDYSRRMDGLAATERAKLAELGEKEKQLNTTFDTMNAQYLRAQQDREQAEIRASQMAAQVKTLAAEWNIPEAEVQKILAGQAAPTPSTAPPSPQLPQNPNPAEFVSRAEFDKLASVALKLPQFAVDFPAMRDQHRQLFGAVPEDFESKILEAARQQQRPLREVWDNLYGVQQKKQEVHDTSIRAEERARADAEWKTKLNQNSVTPSYQMPAAASPIFNLEPLNKNATRPQRTQQGSDSDVSRASQRFMDRYAKRERDLQEA